MLTADIYDQLILHQTIILTIPASDNKTAEEMAATIKRRLIKKRYRDRKLLGEFADNKKLKFTLFPCNNKLPSEDKVKLRVDLVTSTEANNPIDALTVGVAL